nr:hypothetical protein [Tanacetum cinerariifolium]
MSQPFLRCDEGSAYCSHAGFDFFVVVEIDSYLDGASLDYVCSQGRSSLSRPRPDALTKSLTPSPDGSRLHRVMPATPSPRAVSNTSSRIWCRRDPSGDGVRDLVRASGRGLLKEDLESSTSRRRQDYNATSSQRYLYMY